MTYIFDIYLNFKNIPYDFYDWNKNDNIIHIKKTPIFIISIDTFNKLINYNIKLDNNIVKTIYRKSIQYDDNNRITCALFSDKNNIIALMFNENGICIKRSFLLIDEELEILNNIDDINLTELKFLTLDKFKYYSNTRKQIQIQEFINQELKKCDKDRLKYIYLECFSTYENDIDKIIKKINKIRKDKNNYKNLYYALKLTSTKNN